MVCLIRTHLTLSRKNSATEMLIGTHDGAFHCDETLACAMLKMLPMYRDAKIIRTRDSDLLASCDIVVDVGGEFDSKRHRYDHHQVNFNHTMKSLDSSKKWTIKLSSAGLIFFYFGREIIAHLLNFDSADPVVEEIFDHVYGDFVREVDASDNHIPISNGPSNYVCVTSLPKRVSYLVPRWTETDPDYDSAFAKAMTLAGDEFKGMVKHFGEDWLPARKLVDKAVKERFEVHRSGRVINLKYPGGNGGRLDWKSHLFFIEKSENLKVKNDILFVIYEDQKTKIWHIRTVPKKGQKISRCALPPAWRGLMDEAELKKISGIKGIKFVHVDGFKGKAETKEDVLEMVDKSLETMQV